MLKITTRNSKDTLVRRGGQIGLYTPLINVKGELASVDMEKAEVFNKFFASVLSDSQDF